MEIQMSYETNMVIVMLVGKRLAVIKKKEKKGGMNPNVYLGLSSNHGLRIDPYTETTHERGDGFWVCLWPT